MRRIYSKLIFYSRDFIKPFALYCIVKNTFLKNTIIYNWNYRKVALIGGIHPTTAKRYVSRLIKEGFCEIRGNNLHFKSQHRISEEKGLDSSLRIHIDCSNVKETYDQLYLALIKINAARQEHADKKRADGTLHEHLPIEKRGSIYFSSRSIGKLTHRCHTTALNLLTRLKKNKFIRSYYMIEKIKRMDLDEFYSIDTWLNASKQGYYFYKKGFLYCHHGQRIEFM